jgi:hypothetical protein
MKTGRRMRRRGRKALILVGKRYQQLQSRRDLVTFTQLPDGLLVVEPHLPPGLYNIVITFVPV